MTKMMRYVNRHSARSDIIGSCCACKLANSSRNSSSSSSICTSGNPAEVCSSSTVTVKSDQIGKGKQRQSQTRFLRMPPFLIRKPSSPSSKVWRSIVNTPILFAVLCAGLGWKFTSLSTTFVSSAANATSSVVDASNHQILHPSNGSWQHPKFAATSPSAPAERIALLERNSRRRNNRMMLTKTKEEPTATESSVPVLHTSKSSLLRSHEAQQQKHLLPSVEIPQRAQRRRNRLQHRNESSGEDLNFFDDNTFSTFEDDVETAAKKAVKKARETLLASRINSTGIDDSIAISQQHLQQQQQQLGEILWELPSNREVPQSSPFRTKMDKNIDSLFSNLYSNTAAAAPDPTRLRPSVEDTTTALVRKGRWDNNLQRNREGKVYILKPLRTKVVVNLVALTALKLFRIFLTVKLWSWFFHALLFSSSVPALIFELGALYLTKTLLALVFDFLIQARTAQWYLHQINSRTQNLAAAEANQEEEQDTNGFLMMQAIAP